MARGVEGAAGVLTSGRGACVVRTVGVAVARGDARRVEGTGACRDVAAVPVDCRDVGAAEGVAVAVELGAAEVEAAELGAADAGALPAEEVGVEALELVVEELAVLTDFIPDAEDDDDS